MECFSEVFSQECVKNKQINKIQLRLDNKIGSDSVKIVSEALKVNNTSLKKIDLLGKISGM